MSINQLIKDNLSSLGYPTEPNIYNGTEPKYITFNYADNRGTLYADDQPNAVDYSVQIHFFVPSTYNYLSDRDKIRNLLFKAGFTYPVITEIVETDTKIIHIIYECDITF